MNRPLISNKSDEEIWSALHKQWIKHNQEKNLTTPEETIEQLYQCCEEYVQVELQEKSLDLSEEELVVGKDEKYSEMSVEDQSILNESELLMNLNAEDKRRKNGNDCFRMKVVRLTILSDGSLKFLQNLFFFVFLDCGFLYYMFALFKALCLHLFQF